MKGSQLKRLQNLEKQIQDDQAEFFYGDIQEIYKECPQILAARDALEDYVIRHGPEPPRFYQHGEDEHLRRWLWALHSDEKAQARLHRLQTMLKHEGERRGEAQEQEAKESVLKKWEWYLDTPAREAREAAEREERRRKMEEERQERERKWQEEHAARQANQQAGAYGNW